MATRVMVLAERISGFSSWKSGMNERWQLNAKQTTGSALKSSGPQLKRWMTRPEWSLSLSDDLPHTISSSE